MIDLWQLLVVNLFGSFWMAVLGIAFVMYIIMVICKVSQVTSLNFLSIFILAMAIGYSYLLVAMLITILLFIVHLFSIHRLINS